MMTEENARMLKALNNAYSENDALVAENEVLIERLKAGEKRKRIVIEDEYDADDESNKPAGFVKLPEGAMPIG